jgi:predicted site-specific integrase-resolvase
MRMVVEHRDRFCRLGSECVEAVVAVAGRALVVVDSAEVDDDLVRDMSEIVMSMCARGYGTRAAPNRAKGGLVAAGSGEAAVA